jgi:ubiquinone/menaquinone biosynthesis C-methylase UbiE
VLELAAEPLEGEGAILDVGCGGGWLLAELAGAGVDPGRLLGVDLIPERVAAARERVPRADLRRADARELPFEDGAFSLVTLLSCLSSMPERGDVDRALAEVSRVSAPGGLVLCYEPWLANPLNPATSRVAGRTLERSLGPASASPRLTGFPPLARRLGRFAPRLYPTLARHAPTHRLTAHERGGARRPRG